MPLLDRVFARVGSADDPRAGQSTFVREMRETAAILKNASSNSFVVVDEIGRGRRRRTDGAGECRLRDAVPGTAVYLHDAFLCVV